MQEKKKKNASHQFEQTVMVNNFNHAENELEAICCTDFLGGGFRQTFGYTSAFAVRGRLTWHKD